MRFFQIVDLSLHILQHRSTEINIPAMFGLENLLDEKDMYTCLHRKMFGRHMTDIQGFRKKTPVSQN